MQAAKRIPDEIFEELSGFTNEESKPITDISSKEFDKKYNVSVINRARIRNSAEAFLSTSIKKIISLIKKESFILRNKKILKSNKLKTTKNNDKENSLSLIDYLKKIFLFWKNLSKFWKMFRILKNVTKLLYKSIAEPIKACIRISGKIIKNFTEFFLKRLKSITKILGNCLKDIFKFLTKLIINLIHSISRGIAIVINFFKSFGTKILAKLKTSLNPIIKNILRLVKILKRIIRKIIKPIKKTFKKLGLKGAKAFKKLGLKAGKKLGLKVAKKVAAKEVGAMIAKAAAKRSATAAAGAVASTATGPGAAIIAPAIAIISALWLAYDIYEIANTAMAISDLSTQLDSLPEEIENLEKDLENSINTKEEEVKKEIILPNLNVLIEEYQKLPEFTEHPTVIKRKKIYETQIYLAFKEIQKVSPELKDIKIKNLSTKELIDKVTASIIPENNSLFKEGELSVLLGNSRGTRELELIEIWKKIINFIKYSFDNLPLTINISKTIKKIKLKIDKIIARFPKVENWLIENMKFIHKDKGFISLYALGGYSETSLYNKFYKVGDKEILKGERNSELIYSIGETSSLLPENINKRIEIKERENKAQSIKTNILNSIKTIILASN